MNSSKTLTLFQRPLRYQSFTKSSQPYTIIPSQFHYNHLKLQLSSISTSDHEHNLHTVQTRDYEHSYLPGILHKPEIQKHYFALRAFHVEIASIRGNRDVNLASLRMQWWKEALSSLYTQDDIDQDQDNNSKRKNAVLGNAENNPIIKSLKHTIQSKNITHQFLEWMISARMEDLHRDNFDTLQEMITFYEKTLSSLLYVHLECCDVHDDKSDEIANCVGIGLGIINAIRSINNGQIGIPNDLLKKYKVNTKDINDPRSIIQNENDDGKKAIQGAIQEMANEAKKYLYYARLHQGNVPRGDARVALLSVVSALRYLEKLEKVQYDIFNETVADVENMESFNGRLWRLTSMFYLGRAWLTGIF
mmetsp:Transcript_22392/g.27436  ORF Transcript_22392/g.27436 Transcript_22392/m.27436 type:complete len:362 (-) Transcript_22392:255-1340(-)